MKPYFAKYLPIEGEIKKGDKFRWIINSEVQGEVHTCNEEGKRPEKYQKVKLFLCSKDIQIGDTVHYTYDHNLKWVVDKVFSTTFISGSGEHPINTIYKVIGEISPEAIWVKEGDEFDEDQIKKMVDLGWGSKALWIEGRDNLGYKPYIEIKGPCERYR